MLYDIFLILHFIGLALGLGSSFSMVTLARTTKDMDPEKRAPFMLKAMVISRNGSIGLLLLIVSGVALMLLKGVGNTFAQAGGAFHAKLTLVVILVGLLGYSQVLGKKVKNGDKNAMAKLAKIGLSMLFVTLLIVVSAVLGFH